MQGLAPVGDYGSPDVDCASIREPVRVTGGDRYNLDEEVGVLGRTTTSLWRVTASSMNARFLSGFLRIAGTRFVSRCDARIVERMQLSAT